VNQARSYKKRLVAGQVVCGN